MIQPFLSKQFFLFLLAGGTAALVNFGFRIFYNQWMSFSNAIVLAYLMGMIAGFVLMRWLVFKKSEQSLGRAISLFATVNILAIIQTWLISMGLVLYVLPIMKVKLWAPEIAHAVGVSIPIFTSYLGHKYYSFR